MHEGKVRVDPGRTQEADRDAAVLAVVNPTLCKPVAARSTVAHGGLLQEVSGRSPAAVCQLQRLYRPVDFSCLCIDKMELRVRAHFALPGLDGMLWTQVSFGQPITLRPSCDRDSSDESAKEPTRDVVGLR